MLTCTMQYGRQFGDRWMFGEICPSCGLDHADTEYVVHVDPQTDNQYIICPTTNERVYGVFAGNDDDVGGLLDPRNPLHFVIFG